VKFEKNFNKVGLDIWDTKYGRWVEGERHRKWSKQFNDAWGAFFEKNPNADRAAILREMNRLRRDPRFQ
jgi:hypothetical protein